MHLQFRAQEVQRSASENISKGGRALFCCEVPMWQYRLRCWPQSPFIGAADPTILDEVVAY
jgi:hypothetical protein